MPGDILLAVVDAVPKAFGLPCLIGPTVRLPPQTFDHQRNQYQATAILKKLLGQISKNALKILGITAVDLFIPIMKFIFGEAQFEGRAALFSTYRLRPEFYGFDPDRPLLLGRSAKEAVHELGHTFGLTHCFKPECVMHSSCLIQETDRKGAGLCPTCQELFKWTWAKRDNPA